MAIDRKLKRVPKHMLRLGLGALTHANWHANYWSPDNECWQELSVLQAAHACEILIKARIAQEHPLLIFEQLPRQKGSDERLSLQHLVENGRTFQFIDLPDRLWAATSIVLPGLECYREFGRLRNCIQHFTTPDGLDPGEEAVRFIYEVIDPFIHKCWGLYAIDYNEDHEPYVYLAEGLIRRRIAFLVSPAAASAVDLDETVWPAGCDGDTEYRVLMEQRFNEAHESGQSRSK